MKEGHRYSIYSHKRLPKEKRTIRLYGEGDDTNKYYRCWNCGFPCKTDRDSLGVDGTVTTETYVDTDAVTKYKPVVIGGCPFCGCSTWKG